MSDLIWIFVLAFVIYAPTLRGSFVFDDMSTILANEQILAGRWREGFWHWRGISRSLHALVVKIWNPAVILNPGKLPPDPLMFHVVNVVLHALNGCLVVWIAGGVGLDPTVSLISGLIFTVHPLASSAASYISAQSTLLSTLFGFIALGLVVNGLDYLAFPFFALAILTKEDAIVVPWPAALLAYLTGSPLWLIFLAIPPIYALYRMQLFTKLKRNNGDVNMARAGLSASAPRLQHALAVIGEHLLRYPMWLVGLGQNPDPDIRPWSWRERRVVMALGFGLNLLVLAALAPSLRLPMLLILVSPLAVYPFIPLPDPVFEHRAYFSILGIALAFAQLAMVLPIVLTVLLIAALASIASYRAMHWHNWMDFWGWAIDEGSVRKTRCLQNMAAFYKLNNLNAEARKYLAVTVAVNPSSASTLCDLADLDARAGNIDGAKGWLEKATARCPEFAQAWFGLGRIHQHENNLAEAKVCFEKHEALARG